MNRFRLVLCIQTLFAASFAQAFDLAKFSHQPPQSEVSAGAQEFSLKVPSAEIKRVRVLAQRKNGIQSIEMTPQGANFVATATFGDASSFSYTFQIEDTDGKLYESAQYTLNQTNNSGSSDELAALGEELEGLKAKTNQLQNNLRTAEAVDPQVLARSKQQELAKALLALSKKEREWNELQEKLKAFEEKEKKRSGVIED